MTSLGVWLAYTHSSVVHGPPDREQWPKMLSLAEHLPSVPGAISSCPTFTQSSICCSMYSIWRWGMWSLCCLTGPWQRGLSRGHGAISAHPLRNSHLDYHRNILSSLPAFSRENYPQPSLFSIQQPVPVPSLLLWWSCTIMKIKCRHYLIASLMWFLLVPSTSSLVTLLPCWLCWPSWSSSSPSSKQIPRFFHTSGPWHMLFLVWNVPLSNLYLFLSSHLLVKIKMPPAQRCLSTMGPTCPH